MPSSPAWRYAICGYSSTMLGMHPGSQEVVVMPKSSKKNRGQLNLLQRSLPTLVLSKEVNQRTVVLLARMLHEHAGRCRRVEKVADHE
jgi:hypothetical protein